MRSRPPMAMSPPPSPGESASRIPFAAWPSLLLPLLRNFSLIAPQIKALDCIRGNDCFRVKRRIQMVSKCSIGVGEERCMSHIQHLQVRRPPAFLASNRGRGNGISWKSGCIEEARRMVSEGYAIFTGCCAETYYMGAAGVRRSTESLVMAQPGRSHRPTLTSAWRWRASTPTR